MGKPRKMLSGWQAPYIQSLMRLIETQSKATLTQWCVGFAEIRIVPLYKKRLPGDSRLTDALAAAQAWLEGQIKLPRAKAVILACHSAAREAVDDPVAQAAARAVGQCASTIHSARHCIGLALYGALAIAYEQIGFDVPWEQIERQAAEACSQMEAALREIAVDNEPDPARIVWHC